METGAHHDGPREYGPFPAIELGQLFTRVRGETVWKIAERLLRPLLRQQEAADQNSIDHFLTLSELCFAPDLDFPNSFSAGL
jgi:hypothetical protein